MKKFIKVFAIGLTAVMVCAFVLVSKNAQAKIIEAPKKQLVPCTITVGTTVTQIGNTCGYGGEGCSPNPCGQ